MKKRKNYYEDYKNNINHNYDCGCCTRIIPNSTLQYNKFHYVLTSLATLLLLRSIEWKKSRDKTGFLFTFIAAVFIYIVVIFNICSSLLGYEKVDNRDCLKDINPSEIVEIKCSGTTGGKDGHFEYFLDERQQEDFVELLGKVKLGRKAEREETLSSGAVTYYTLEFEDGEVLEVSPGRFFM